MEFSERIKNLPASPIRKLMPFANRAKAKGVHIFHLNIGQPDIETPKIFWETLKNFDEKVLAYSPSEGFLALREKWAKYYGRFLEKSLTAENFLVTTGASEALQFTFSAIADVGENIIIPEPFYANYYSIATERSILIKPVTTYLKKNFALPEPEEFYSLIDEKTRGILVCNPVNPTGKLYSEADLRKLAKIAREKNIFLIVDEVYREFVYEGNKHFSVLNIDGLEENVIVIDSVSKRFSACGARSGVVVSRNKVFLENVLKLAQARLSPPTLAQIGSAALLELPQEYYEQITQKFDERRKTLLAELRKIDGIKLPEVLGAFYVIAELPVDDTEDFCRWMLEEFSYNGKTVMMAPASGFYANRELGKKQVRIAYVLEKELLKEAGECLREGIKAYQER